MTIWGDIRSTRATGVQNLDGVEVGLLGNTIGGSTNGAGNVSAVAVAVGVVVVDKVAGPGGAATKVRVVGVDASVNHVGAGAGTGAVVVGVLGGTRLLGREAGNAPGGAVLRDILVDGEDGLLLDVLNLCGGLMMKQASSRGLILTSGRARTMSKRAPSSLPAKPLNLPV